jgi:hypothetical protein
VPRIVAAGRLQFTTEVAAAANHFGRLMTD